MQLLPLFNTQVAEQISTATFDPCFTEEEVDKILFNVRKDGGVINTVAEGLNKEIRQSKAHPIPHIAENQWLYEKLADRIARANLHYDFNINGIYETLAIMEYNVGGHYDWHIDIGPGLASYRKLSGIIQLSNPDDYEGGDVLFKAGNKEHTLPRDKGQLAVFPSYVLHKVTPVTKGTRYSLVTWVSGQRRWQ